MRKLHLYRERALACFALRYHYFVNSNPDTLKAQISADPNPLETWLNNPISLRNGERIIAEIPDEESTLFVAVITENRIMISNQITLPPEIPEPSVKIITDFDGYHRLQVRCEPENA